MDIPSIKKARSQVKGFFVKNAIPTESNFADLIEASLNQRDDGVVKSQGAPLSIEAGGGDDSQKHVLALYRSFQDPQPVATLSLSPFETRNDPNSRVDCLGIGDAAGNVRVSIDPAQGRLGIGTVKPQAALDVRNGPGHFWLSLGPGGDAGRATLRHGGPGNPAAPTLTLSDKSHPPRIRFDIHGTGNEAAPQHSAWIGLARGNTANLALMPPGDGRVGVGTNNPQGKLDVNGFTHTLGLAVNKGSNTGVGRGLYLWRPNDTNHVIYSASPTGKSPANKPAVKGHWDARHRMRFRTAKGQGFLFENNQEVAVLDIDADNGNVWMRGALRIGGSDLYFTETNHTHTGAGNKAGWAAIENSKNYGALMILGRTVSTRPLKRVVKVWDELTVNGKMIVHANKVEGYKYSQNALTIRTNHGFGTMGCLNTTWFHFGTDRSKFFFDRPTHAKGGFHLYSKRETKKDIEYLSASDEAKYLKSVVKMGMVRFRHADDNLDDKLHVGVIAEEAPKQMVADGNESIDIYDYASMAMIAVRALHREVSELRRDVKKLKAKSA
jgi:hypothetical protein